MGSSFIHLIRTHWKECWWNYSSLVIWCKWLSLWKSPWYWERLRAEEDEGIRGWDGWKASLMQWTWTWTNLRRWWGTGRPGVLQAMGLQRVRPKWVTAKKNLNDICTSEFGKRPEGTTGSWEGWWIPYFQTGNQPLFPLFPGTRKTDLSGLCWIGPPNPTPLPNTLAATVCIWGSRSENKATPLSMQLRLLLRSFSCYWKYPQFLIAFEIWIVTSKQVFNTQLFRPRSHLVILIKGV